MALKQPVLYVSGLGVMISSPDALQVLEPHVDHSDRPDGSSDAARGLFDAHRLVYLGTGSPQLHYGFVVESRAPTEHELASALASDGFDIELTGGGLVIRDGYDLMEWEPESVDSNRFEIAAGRYHVNALWLPHEQGSGVEMLIGLYLRPATDELEGDGWPYVEYDGRLPDD